MFFYSHYVVSLLISQQFFGAFVQPGHIYALQPLRQFVRRETCFPVKPKRRFVFLGAAEEQSAKMDVVFVILQVLWLSCKIN